MSTSTRSTRELLRTIEGRWPNASDPTWAEAVETRLDALLSAQPDEVSDQLRGWLGDPTREVAARAAVYALQVAGTSGLSAVRWLDEDRMLMRDAEGRDICLALFGIDAPWLPAGDPASIAALSRALDEAFGERRYVLWLRQPLPSNLDAAAIGRAVTLWLTAIDRGEWRGNHAVYEDDGVELELVVTGTTGRMNGSALALRLDPVTSLERLRALDAALVDRAAAHDQEHKDIPLVFVVGASGPLRLPRGFAEQLLYGTADWTVAQTDPPLYEAAFHPNGRSLFSDPLASNVAAVWWLEPDAEDPLGFRSWSHENPWARCTWSPEPVPGPRYYRAAGDEGPSGREVDLMRWSAPPPRYG